MLTFTFVLSILMLVFLTIQDLYKRDFVNPMTLFVFPVAIGYILYYVYFQYVWTISEEAQWLYILTIVAFAVGSLIVNFVPFETQFDEHTEKGRLSSAKVVPMFFWLSGIVLTGLSIVYLRRLGLSGSDLRDAFIANVASYPFYVTYGKYFLIFGTTFYQFQGFSVGWTRKNVLFSISGFIVVLYASLLTQARTDILISVLPLMVLISVFKLSSSSIKTFLGYSVVSVAALFLLFSMLQTVEASRFGATETVFFSAQNQIFQYIGLPLVAFDRWYVANNYSGVLHGWGIVQLFDKVSTFLGVQVPTLSLAARGQFNVYSFLAGPYAGIGRMGTIGIMFVTGVITKILYKFATTYKGYGLIFYAVFADTLFLSFFSWQLTSMVNLYAFIFVILLKFEVTSKKNEEF